MTNAIILCHICVQVMALANGGVEALAQLDTASKAMAAVSEEVDVLTDRWLELAELAGDL